MAAIANHTLDVSPFHQPIAGTFLQRNGVPAPPPDEQRRLFLDFLNKFLQVEIYGFQSGFGVKSDLILFRHPTTGCTLAVPTSTMLLPVEQARRLVQNKITASSAAFGLVAL
jgi:hypothetical protein